MRFGSILGSTFTVQALAAMSNRPLVESVRALKEAADARVLGESESGSRMVFRHDLIREAIYQELPRPLRMGLHREAAQALSNVGAPSVEVAKHLLVGATPGDGEAVGWLQQAAQETAARSPAAAVELLQRALELLEPSDPRYATRRRSVRQRRDVLEPEGRRVGCHQPLGLESSEHRERKNH